MLERVILLISFQFSYPWFLQVIGSYFIIAWTSSLMFLIRNHLPNAVLLILYFACQLKLDRSELKV